MISHLIDVLDIFDVDYYNKKKGGSDMDLLSPKQQAIIENLQDAGCDKAWIMQFLELVKAGQIKEQFAWLAKYRNFLLECLHKRQKQLDCLDYLIYTLKKQMQKETGGMYDDAI